MADIKIDGKKPKQGGIICHETKQGIKCSYDGPIYTRPKEDKPKEKPETSTF